MKLRFKCVFHTSLHFNASRLATEHRASALYVLPADMNDLTMTLFVVPELHLMGLGPATLGQPTNQLPVLPLQGMLWGWRYRPFVTMICEWTSGSPWFTVMPQGQLMNALSELHGALACSTVMQGLQTSYHPTRCSHQCGGEPFTHDTSCCPFRLQ